MKDNFSVVMYHYVRDLKNSRYPFIKGLDKSLFKEQMLFFKKHYNCITASELVDAIYNGANLPPKALMITFDDAYIDHYTTAFPILNELNIQGTFFVPVKAIMNHEVLIVNKIHHVLAVCAESIDKLLEEIKSLLLLYSNEFHLESYEYYFSKLAVANRFDPKEVIFIKRLLQVELQEPVRSAIISRLFAKYVSSDENSFSRELYMTEDQLKCMIRNGMVIGSHGYDHFWLSSLTIEQQKVEISKSFDFLTKLEVDMNTLSIGYPYGDNNDETIKIAHELGFKLGYTTVVDVVEAKKSNTFNALRIPRLDTNDFPKEAGATPNKWFYKV